LTLCSALAQAIRDDVSGVRENVLGIIDRVDQLQMNCEGKTSLHIYRLSKQLDNTSIVSLCMFLSLPLSRLLW
jgi:hypothetical protein